MLAKAFRGLNRSLRDYRWFLYYLQRETTWNPRRREQIATLIGRCLPGGKVTSPSEMSRAMADGLKRNGFAMADGLVSSDQVNDIREYLERQRFYDPRHPEMGGVSDLREVPSTCYHGYYPDDVVVGAPHLMRIANDPLIVDALELLFGSKPTITTALIWWLFSSYDFADKEREQFLWNTSNMHRDIDDWLQIKLFIYLTDVAEETAPHLFLQGSHRGGPGEGKSTLPLDFAAKSCSENVIAVHGKAGVAWLENPFGFHLGKRPETGNRLIAAISYSLLPTPFTIGRASALPEGLKTFDPYINRLWMAPNKDARKN